MWNANVAFEGTWHANEGTGDVLSIQMQVSETPSTSSHPKNPPEGQEPVPSQNAILSNRASRMNPTSRGFIGDKYPSDSLYDTAT